MPTKNLEDHTEPTQPTPPPQSRSGDRRAFGTVALVLAATAAISFFVTMLNADTVDLPVGLLRLLRLALAFFICHRLAQGSNWARWWAIVACAFGALTASFQLWKTLQSGTFLGSVFALLIAAVCLTCIYVLAFSASAARLFPETPDRI
jgi:hypothetical protein